MQLEPPALGSGATSLTVHCEPARRFAYVASNAGFERLKVCVEDGPPPGGVQVAATTKVRLTPGTESMTTYFFSLNEPRGANEQLSVFTTVSVCGVVDWIKMDWPWG